MIQERRIEGSGKAAAGTPGSAAAAPTWGGWVPRGARRCYTAPMHESPEPSDASWFVRAFDDLYASLYAHRDAAEARALVASLRMRGLETPVLDVACGSGRLLHELRAARIPALGFDLSRPLLQRARALVVDGAPAGLARADMRRWPFAARSLGAAIMLFTSFGYFATRAEDRLVLEEAARTLRPTGRFVLDFLNRTRTVRDLSARSERTVEGRRVVETRWIDEGPEGPYVCKRIEVGAPAGVPGHATEYVERVRLYTPDELVSALEAAGLHHEETWGLYDGTPFDPETSLRCILVSRRSESAP